MVITLSRFRLGTEALGRLLLQHSPLSKYWRSRSKYNSALAMRLCWMKNCLDRYSQTLLSLPFRCVRHVSPVFRERLWFCWLLGGFCFLQLFRLFCDNVFHDALSVGGIYGLWILEIYISLCLYCYNGASYITATYMVEVLWCDDFLVCTLFPPFFTGPQSTWVFAPSDCVSSSGPRHWFSLADILTWLLWWRY